MMNLMASKKKEENLLDFQEEVIKLIKQGVNRLKAIDIVLQKINTPREVEFSNKPRIKK
jgi:hypothetical protein